MDGLTDKNHFRCSTLITFPSLTEEYNDFVTGLRQEFEKTQSIECLSFDELYEL